MCANKEATFTKSRILSRLQFDFQINGGYFGYFQWFDYVHKIGPLLLKGHLFSVNVFEN